MNVNKMTYDEIIACIEGIPEVGSVAVLPDETNVDRIHGSNHEDSTVTEGIQQGKLLNMPEIFKKLIAADMSFEKAAEFVGAKTEEEINFLKEHAPAQ